MLTVPDGTAAGGNKRGASSIDLQNSRASAAQVGSGSTTVTLGGSSTSSSTGAISIGISNTSAHLNAVTMGSFCSTSAQAGIALGSSAAVTATGGNAQGINATADANYAQARGFQAHTRGVIGIEVVASGQYATAGDAQRGQLYIKATTTTNTPVAMTSDAQAASTNNQIILLNNQSASFVGVFQAKQSGSANSASWLIRGTVTRGANAASTTIGTCTVERIDNAIGWPDPTVAADTTNGGVTFAFPGVSATNIRCVGAVTAAYIGYA